uniref:Immunoglobulin domain-containing protein n=1 Tax=Salmo trutta TaxID=8032 RepID=A0A673Z1D7_SALTR
MGVDASSWTAEVPSSVSGLQGSCIVIPCSFNYPEPEEKPSEFTGIWFKDTHDTIYHPDSSNIIKDYRGRTELVGDLRQKNCSLRIDPLHPSDKGPFFFRVEIEDQNKYSYIHDTVSIAVSSKFPGEELTRRISNVVLYITDHNQSLVCTAEHRGGKTVKMSKTLNVKCKWTTPVC